MKPTIDTPDEPRFPPGLRSDYIGLAAVVFAIVVSLVGVCVVIVESSSEQPRQTRLVIAIA